MSDKDRRKKDGHDKGKENQAMHEAVHERQEQAEQSQGNDPHQMNPDRANRPGSGNH